MATGCILLVEDDEIIRESIADILRDEGHVVFEVGNGREALDWLQQHAAPALILLDLYMPIMTGMEFRGRQLQDPAIADIPVIMVSAVDGGKAAALGIREHLPKPIDVDTLLACVDAHKGG